MTDMIERVARAIVFQQHKDLTIEPLDPSKILLNQADLDTARAAIEAMRSLPDGICQQLAGHFDNDVTYGHARAVKSLWEDGIDAALK